MRHEILAPRVLAGVMALAGTVALAMPALAPDIVTSFEFTNTTGDFELGTSPRSARFVGGEAKATGNPALAHTGTNAWLIAPGKTAMITFETPGAMLEIFLRDENASVQSTVTLLDKTGAVLMTVQGNDTGWTQIQHTSTTAPAAQVMVKNNGTTGDVAIDDLAYTGLQGGAPLADPIPATIPPRSAAARLKSIASGMTAPNLGTSTPADPRNLFVTDQNGIVWAVDLVNGNKRIFLDVSARLVALGAFGPGTFDERGLLGLAFHPQYGQYGLLYTFTSEPVSGTADFTTMPPGTTPNCQSVIAEWHVQNPGSPSSVVDPNSRRELIRIDKPQFNHNAGGLEFGHDNLLYIALGDGGGADDVDGQDSGGTPMVGHGLDGNGQDKNNVLGAILRVDPLGSNSTNGEYGIPPNNPFVGAPGVDEIFAYGFRNPFRFSFDRVTGVLYAGDVGQNDVEELDIVVPGGNYGWNWKEGSFFFDPNGHLDGFVTDFYPGVPAGLIDPIAQYDHDEGLAIIGGYVYRGTRLPHLVGAYIFGDFQRPNTNEGRMFFMAGGEIFEFVIGGSTSLGFFVNGIGQDAFGELYVMGNTTGTPFGQTGTVHKLVPIQ